MSSAVSSFSTFTRLAEAFACGPHTPPCTEFGHGKLAFVSPSKEGERYSVAVPRSQDTFCATRIPLDKEPADLYQTYKDDLRKVMDVKKYTPKEWKAVFENISDLPPKGALGTWFKDLCDTYLPAGFNSKDMKRFLKAYKATRRTEEDVPSHYAVDWVRHVNQGGNPREDSFASLGRQSTYNCYAYAVGKSSLIKPIIGIRASGYGPGALSGGSGLFDEHITSKRLHDALVSDGAQALRISRDLHTDQLNTYLSALQQAGHTVFASYIFEDGSDYHFARYHSKGPYRWSHKPGFSNAMIHDSTWEHVKTRHGRYAMLDGCFAFAKYRYEGEQATLVQRTINPQQYAIIDPRTAVFKQHAAFPEIYLYQDCYVRPNPDAKESVESIRKRVFKPSWMQCAATTLKTMWNRGRPTERSWA
jgi:hypothetical protein